MKYYFFKDKKLFKKSKINNIFKIRAINLHLCQRVLGTITVHMTPNKTIHFAGWFYNSIVPLA